MSIVYPFFFGVLLGVVFAFRVVDLNNDLDKALARISVLEDAILTLQTSTSCSSSCSAYSYAGFTPTLISSQPTNNLFSPGVNLAVYTGNISWPDSTTIDTGATAYPAAFINGTLITKTIIADDIIVNTYRGQRSLSQWYKAIDEMNADVCDPETVCEHGSMVNCLCVCEEHWSGDLCDTHDCFGFGTWSTKTAQCTCDDSNNNATSFCLRVNCFNGEYSNIDETCVCSKGWEGVTCNTQETTCVHTCINGECYDGKCVCNYGYFGQRCQYICATPGPDNTLCPQRSNSGVDMRCIVEEETLEKICVCGGGFHLTEDATTILQLRCGKNVTLTECQQKFSQEAPECCLPESRCGSMWGLCTTDECCNSAGSVYNKTSCLYAGCAWCADGCLLEGDGTGDTCEEPVYTAAIGLSDLGESTDTSLQWEKLYYNYTYSKAAATAYRNLYYPCIYNLYLDIDCGKSVHSVIQKLAWPDLNKDQTFYPGVPTQIVLYSTDNTLCNNNYPALSIKSLPKKYTRNATVAWKCPGEDDTLGTTMVFAQDNANVEHTNYYLYKVTTGGDVFCLTEGPLNSTEKIWIFRTELAEDSLFWLNLREQASDYVVMDPSFCTRWYIDGSTIRSSSTKFYIGEVSGLATESISSGGYLDFSNFGSRYPKKIQ